MREITVEQYLVKQVYAHGLLERKIKYLGRRGATDRLVVGVLRGKKITWFVEVKSPTGKPDPIQAAEHERLRRYGQDVFVVSTHAEVDALFA